MVVMDVGHGRLCLHPRTGFTLGLIGHPGATGRPFTEMNTGLDHVGLSASSRDELVEWERRFDALGVPYTPIRDMEFGAHLNFRDPDNIPLEFTASNEWMAAALHDLRTREVPREEILARIEQVVGSDYRPR